jgi:predicted Zn-dependent peptidase
VRRLLHTAFVLLILCPAAAPHPAEAAELAATLDNGLRVVVRSPPERSLVEVEIFFAAGSAVEPDSLAGLAHATEHMLCRYGAGPEAGALARRHTLLTLRSNANTSSTAMDFWSQCLPAFLPEVLTLTAEQMRIGSVDSLGFERERRVVLEEAAYRGAWLSSPTALAFGACFPDHPFGRAVIGTETTIGRLTGNDITAFARTRIQPATGVLIIEGPVDPAATMEQVRERFGSLPGDPTVPPSPAPPPAAARDLIVDNSSHDGYRMAAVSRVPLTTPRDFALLDLAVSYLQREFIYITFDLLPREAVVSAAWRGGYYQPGDDEWSDRRFNPDEDVQDSWSRFWLQTNDLIDDLADSEKSALLQTWLQTTVADRLRKPLDRGILGRAMVCGVSLPSTEEFAGLLAGIGLADIRDFLARNLTVERTAAAVSHGGDSGRNVGRSPTGRVNRGHEVATADPLAALTAADIRPTLQAYRDTDLLKLHVLHLGNGVPVICRNEPVADDWQLAGWRRLEAVDEARAGKRPGLCELYNNIVPFEPEPVTETRPLRPWRFDSTFELDPAGDFRFQGVCASDSAIWLADVIGERLRSDRLNTSVWAEVRRRAPDRFASKRGAAENIAAAWRCGQILGPDHPALSHWAPDPAITDGLKYAALQKLHRRAATPDGDLTLTALGALSPDSVLAVLEPRFGRHGRYEPLPSSPPPPGPGAIAGKIVFSPMETDVDLTLAFPAHRPDPAATQPGLTLLLLGELVTQALDSRLRQQEGWTYHARCRIEIASGWALPEITVTCQPGQAFAVFDLVRQELARLGRGVGPDEFERARLHLLTRLLLSADDRADLNAWLQFVTGFGPVPADPITALLTITDEDTAGAMASLLPESRFVFTATGAIFEDDLGSFEY